MRIRSRLFFSILPPLVVLFVASSLFTLHVVRRGINQIERDLLRFKSIQLHSYVISQWNLLVEFDLYYQEELVRTAHNAIKEYATGLLKSPEAGDTTTERPEDIFALINSGEARGTVAFRTDPDLDIGVAEAERLLAVVESQEITTQEGGTVVEFDITDIAGVERAYSSFRFDEFSWTVFVSERVTFFNLTNNIIQAIALTAVIVAVVLFAIILLLLGTSITRPLRRMTDTAESVISKAPEISDRLPFAYNDEIGILALTFNLMFRTLDANYQRLRTFAFNSVVNQQREARVRTVFQKYVPQQLIDKFTKQPDALLSGENREIAILFSDIRNFSTISERMQPEELVTTLNGYFTLIVDAITDNRGVIDKYIGDAVMALFGAPAKYPNDAQNSVNAALGMLAALKRFNAGQAQRNGTQFAVGIGIHYGTATVGNIGSEKKIDYTAIGDSVNLASRLEGLCKRYQQHILISKKVLERIGQGYNTRFVDRVAVKGKTQATNVYTVLPNVTREQQSAYASYHRGVQSYYAKNFSGAIEYLKAAHTMLPHDYLVTLFVERATRYLKQPPPVEWKGVVALDEK